MIFLPCMIPYYQTFQPVSVAHQKPLNYLGTIVNIYSCFLWKRECCCTVLVTPWIFFLASYDLRKHFKPLVVSNIMQVWPNVSKLFSLWSFPPSLRGRRLEVAGERENGRSRGRHACLLLARPFFLVPTTSKRLLRRLIPTLKHKERYGRIRPM